MKPYEEKAYWTRKRIRRLSWSLILAITAGLMIGGWIGIPEDSGVKEGDFPNFYAAGMMIKNGLGSHLYDFDSWIKIQSQYWPSMQSYYIPFLYPAFFAVLLAPLAFFPPLTAKFIFTVLMIAFIFLAFYLAQSYAPVLKGNMLTAAACGICFLPLLFSVISGQNAAFSMFLYSAALASFKRGTPFGDLLCGLYLGLWLFKPQYGFPFILLMTLTRSWLVLGASVMVAIIYYFLGAFFLGFKWPWAWWEAVRQYDLSVYFVPHMTVSFIGISKAFTHFFDFASGHARMLESAGYVLAGSLAAALGVLFWKAGKIQDPKIKSTRLLHLLFLAGPVVILISPHALYYDLGILVFSLVPYLRFQDDRSVYGFILLMILIAACTLALEQLPVQPLFLLALGSGLFVWKNIQCEQDLLKK